MKLTFLTIGEACTFELFPMSGKRLVLIHPQSLCVASLSRKTTKPHLSSSIWKFSEAALQNSFKGKKINKISSCYPNPLHIDSNLTCRRKKIKFSWKPLSLMNLKQHNDLPFSFIQLDCN